VVISAAILVNVRIIPADVMAALRREAKVRLARRPRSIVGATVIIAVWLAGRHGSEQCCSADSPLRWTLT